MKKYSYIYNEIKNLILSGQLKAGDKIPSVRKASQIYMVSTTTIQNAYFELCADGYIIAHSKSGYYVSDIENTLAQEEESAHNDEFRFDFTGETADAEIFDFALWQKYIKNALRQHERLLSYSEAQGEYDLRCAIAEYIKNKRNVITSPDRIIIGAGVQPILQIICSLLDKNFTVSFPDKSFNLGMNIFSDYGFEVHTRDKDADIIYVSPSHMTRWGDVMPIKRRLELIEYSQNHNSIVIEDDYENEFLYNVTPTPSLFALGKGNIIYMSSFSAMLLPGIRISFAVLTKELSEKFKNEHSRFAQTASKTEQIALCQYIRDGHINVQTKKIRRIYTAKTKKFAALLKNYIPNAKIEIGENTLQIILSAKFNKSIDIFRELSLNVFIEKYIDDKIVLVISPSGIPLSQLEEAAITLNNALN